jgi:hypothetical protein
MLFSLLANHNATSWTIAAVSITAVRPRIQDSEQIRPDEKHYQILYSILLSRRSLHQSVSFLFLSPYLWMLSIKIILPPVINGFVGDIAVAKISVKAFGVVA